MFEFEKIVYINAYIYLYIYIHTQHTHTQMDHGNKKVVDFPLWFILFLTGNCFGVRWFFGGWGVKCIDFQYSIAQMMQEKTLKEREKRNNKNKQNEKTL